jgi:hypothetical protein
MSEQSRRRACAKAVEIPCGIENIFSESVFSQVAAQCQILDSISSGSTVVSNSVAELSAIAEMKLPPSQSKDKSIIHRLNASIMYTEAVLESIRNDDMLQPQLESSISDAEDMLGEIQDFLRNDVIPIVDQERVNNNKRTRESKHGSILSDDDDIDEVCKGIQNLNTDSETEHLITREFSSTKGLVLLSDDD